MGHALLGKQLNKTSLIAACRTLAEADARLASVLSRYGPPPLWDRPPGFATLLHIILEQQVSLASARACVDKLEARIVTVSPENVLNLSDPELKAIGFSRQKTLYARHLSEAVAEGRLDLERLNSKPDEDVRLELKKLKGIGDWTCDIYLLMAMLRPDVMPKGDLALHAAWRRLSNAERGPDAVEFAVIAEAWKPFRSVAARLLWHFYLSEKNNGNAKAR